MTILTIGPAPTVVEQPRQQLPPSVDDDDSGEGEPEVEGGPEHAVEDGAESAAPAGAAPSLSPTASSVRPTFATEEEEMNWALGKLEHCIRSRRNSQRFIAAVESARARFLDERALNAGAKGNPLYTDAALTVRQVRAREHAMPPVRRALSVPPDPDPCPT